MGRVYKTVALSADEANEFEVELSKTGLDISGFIKLRCLPSLHTEQLPVDKPNSIQRDFELETEEEHRSTARISNVILRNLPISALTFNELKRLDLIYSVILKKNKVDHLGTNATELVKVAQNADGSSQYSFTEMFCPEVSCSDRWPKSVALTALSDHLRSKHNYTQEQINIILEDYRR